MSRATKAWLIIAASLILVGCMIFGGMMMALKWNFIKLSTSRYETNEYTIKEAYQNISIVADTADVIFVPSETAETEVTCYEQNNVKHSVAVKNGTLVIEVIDTRRWYEYIGINFDTPKITVYLPQSGYNTLSVKLDTGDVVVPVAFKFASVDITGSTGDVTFSASVAGTAAIKTSTGDIRVENVSVGALDLSVSTGKVTVSGVTCEGDVTLRVSTGDSNLTDVTCKNLISNGSTGGLSLENVVATETFSIERSTGDVKLSDCDAAEILIKTDTGDVKGTLLSEKVFITETDTGRVSVPKSTTGGRCEIHTDTGNIKISIP